MARAKIRGRKARGRPLTMVVLRKLAGALPGVEEGTSYGTPGFRCRKRLLARIHQKEPAVVLSVGDEAAQQTLIAMDPSVFYIIDHYVGTSWVLARLPKLRVGQLRDVFEASWRGAASAKQLAELDG